ncbi:hypothetical protein SCOCK_500027 [Actinacidiphila cocklensis]|uniref:Uncharacterized protein n=1 Tax=Actinacidiphila cocklensis TaxID=887465 RepID=A0A9W4GW00_9ACTN|nr:hypothetical protein SCOCK_500027 [Actinacidiphila cocklensis]
MLAAQHQPRVLQVHQLLGRHVDGDLLVVPLAPAGAAVLPGRLAACPALRGLLRPGLGLRGLRGDRRSHRVHRGGLGVRLLDRDVRLGRCRGGAVDGTRARAGAARGPAALRGVPAAVLRRAAALLLGAAVTALLRRFRVALRRLAVPAGLLARPRPRVALRLARLATGVLLRLLPGLRCLERRTPGGPEQLVGTRQGHSAWHRASTSLASWR